jgi:hypothetical protein
MRFFPQLLLGAALALLTCGASNARPAALNPALVAGVYKVQFQNGLVGGEAYRSENILEIVQTGPATAYVRTHLEFYNGHLCAIWGIAHVEGGELVYRSKEPAYPAGAPPCTLRVSVEGGQVRLEDNGTCKSWCGARGAFGGTAFPTASRRPIRYLARLKASRLYAEALAVDAR